MKRKYSDDGWGTVPEWLTEDEWNFDNVPDSEILACCVWEFARESESIRFAADLHWCHTRDISNREKYKKDPIAKDEDDNEAALIERRAKNANFDYDGFVENFWACDLATINIYDSVRQYVRDGACSWQTLPQQIRSRLAKGATESIVFSPLRPSLVGELERIWKESSQDLNEARKTPRYDDSEEAALYAESTPAFLPQDESKSRPPLGEVAVAFTIDFSRFTDAEICNALNSWLKTNRPANWRCPQHNFLGSKQRGRKLVEYRVALERLGLMRILHWLTPLEMQSQIPKAWAKYRKKQAGFRREIREVNKTFHKLFPFIPQNERPSSETRTAIWRKESEEIAKRIDREFKIKAGA